MVKIAGTRSPVQLQNQLNTTSTNTKTPNLGLGKDTFAQSQTQTALGTQLGRAVEGGSILKSRSSGPEVRELQQMLNRAGAQPPLETDGKFGPMTETALRSFQTKNNIGIDGKFGPESLGALRGALGMEQPTNTTPTVTPNNPNLAPMRAGDMMRSNQMGLKGLTPTNNTPNIGGFATEPGRVTTGFGATQGQREQQAEDILRANGQWPPQEGRAYAIQIDQDAPPSSASRSDRNQYVRAYTGETAVFRVQNGRLVEQNSNGPYRSASHPGQYTTGRSGLDVNGDGAADIAHIRPGVYNYRARPNGSGRYNPTNNRQFEVARDINHDGVIDGSEKNNRFSASGIQIHVGGNNRPSSIGCQTMPPNDYSDFQQAVRTANSGNNNDFTYVLVRRPNDQFGENRF